MSDKPVLYSLENLTAIYGNDKEIVASIVGIFVENIPVYISEMTNAVNASDWPALAFTAHKLKSNVKLFVVTAIIDDVTAIEQKAKATTQTETLPFLINKVTNMLLQVESAMKKDMRS